MLLGNAVDSLVTYEKLQHPGPTLKKPKYWELSIFITGDPTNTLICHFMRMGIAITPEFSNLPMALQREGGKPMPISS